MFGIGMSEMLIILAVALLVFGPQKLPEIAKSIAKGLKELRRAGDDLRSSVNFDLDDDKPARRPLPRASSVQPPVSPSDANAAPTSSSPTEPAAIPGSELATGVEEQWPKPAADTMARGDEIEPSSSSVSTATATATISDDQGAPVDDSKVH